MGIGGPHAGWRSYGSGIVASQLAQPDLPNFNLIEQARHGDEITLQAGQKIATAQTYELFDFHL